MDPTRRLLFWFKIPYAADAALFLIGLGLLLAGRFDGWWVLLAPKLIGRNGPQNPNDPEPPDREG
jgi:hypothetical protein